MKHEMRASRPRHAGELGMCSGFEARTDGDALTEAFSRRAFAVPWQGCRPVADDEVETTLARIFATPRTEPAVAYIHVPYCQNHCLFCGFFQNVWRPEASRAYVDDLVDEIARMSETPLVSSAAIEAIYIGGGTPSALDADDLARLVRSLHRCLPLAPDCEITLEGRAYDFGLRKAEAALDAGATRISLGVQSFDTTVRKQLGRKLSGDQVRAFVSELVALDRAAIVCDLIYGLPAQSDEIWREDIDTAMALGLDGLSLYALNVWRGGPLSRAIENGKLPPAGALPAQATAYAAAVGRLVRGGWRHVSQAHFVRSGRERNRYNLAIKGGTPCLAFGPGAGGQAHGHRWRNIVDIERRRMMMVNNRLPIEGLAQLPEDQPARNAITSGLEDGDVDLKTLESLAPGFNTAAAPLIENWVAAGLGDLDAGHFRTTPAGAFWMTTLNGGLNAALDRVTSPSTTTGAEQ